MIEGSLQGVNQSAVRIQNLIVIAAGDEPWVGESIGEDRSAPGVNGLHDGDAEELLLGGGDHDVTARDDLAVDGERGASPSWKMRSPARSRMRAKASGNPRWSCPEQYQVKVGSRPDQRLDAVGEAR